MQPMHPTPWTMQPWILTVMTYLLTVVIWGQADNCYQFKKFALLMYSRGVSPRIPSNLMTSQHPHSICLHSLILISQSAISLPVSQSVFSSPFRPCPPMDCINHGTCCASFILTLTSRKTTSTTLNHLLHLHATSTALSYLLHPRVVIHIQGKCTSFFNAH